MPKNDHKCSKNGHFWNLNFQVFFFQNWKTQFSNQIVIYVIAFDQINIQICLAPQNDRQILSFLKYSYVLGQKMTRNGRKLAKRKSCQFFKSPVFMCTWNSRLNFKFRSTFLQIILIFHLDFPVCIWNKCKVLYARLAFQLPLTSAGSGAKFKI